MDLVLDAHMMKVIKKEEFFFLFIPCEPYHVSLFEEFFFLIRVMLVSSIL